MESLKNNKLLWAVVVVLVVNLGVLVGGNFVINKIADRVIEKLQKEYSPSPYGPGFDPDKIDPNSINKQKAYFKFSKETTGHNVIWRDEWEQNRGF